MTSEDIYKIVQEIFKTMESPIITDISDAFIPFSNIPNDTNCRYIYDGYEKIPFKERHQEYQEILIYEFSII